MESNAARGASGPLYLAACAVGAAAGLTAVAYRFALTQSEWLSDRLFALGASVPGFLILFAALLALGFAVGGLTRLEPLIGGSGIPQVEAEMRGLLRPGWLRVLCLKFVGGALCAVGGLSLGREGPSIQLGAMASEGLSRRAFSRLDQRTLLLCGACAGLSAAFNAPLAGVLFAIEEVHKRFDEGVVYAAMIASMTAAVISALFFGTGAVMGLAPVQAFALPQYGYYVLMGVATGLFGALYNGALMRVKRLYKRLPVKPEYRLMIPFALSGVLGLALPQVLGSGHRLLEPMAAGLFPLGMLALLLLVKFAFSLLCFCSGAPGGIFFPLLILGALVGALVGALAIRYGGVPDAYLLNFLLLGMAGLFAGIVRAPLTGVVLVLEMSGSLTQLVGLSVVSLVSCLVATALRSRPIYEQLLDDLTGERAA